jgi:hypothetical protein
MDKEGESYKYFLKLSEDSNRTGRNVRLPESIARKLFSGNRYFVSTPGFQIGHIRWGRDMQPFFSDNKAGEAPLAGLTPEEVKMVTLTPAEVPSLRKLAARKIHTDERSRDWGTYVDPTDPDNAIPLEVRDRVLKEKQGGRRYSRTKVKMPRRHTKKRGTRRHKKQRGGFYSFNGAVGTGAPAWSRGSEMGGFVVDKSGNIGNMGPDGMRPPIQYGRGRKRKSRGRKTRRMRGGGKYGAVAASYVGTGSRGIADRVGTNTKYPPFGGPAHGAFNDGARHSMASGQSFNILPLN